MSMFIKGGRVIDPANKIDALMDILIEGNKISKVAKNIKVSTGEVIDATGKIVAPGIIDMHVHLREPGREDKETVATATAAAGCSSWSSRPWAPCPITKWAHASGSCKQPMAQGWGAACSSGMPQLWRWPS